MPFDLTGKTALVTGGASGLGLYFSEALAEAGARVVLASRRADALDASVARIWQRGAEAFSVILDVRDAFSVEEAIAAAESIAGPLDILINNSGVAHQARAVDLAEDDWDAVMDTNLKGAWLMSRAFARRAMAVARPGSIVNIASVLGLRTASQVSAYAVSKAGIIHLTRVLALEFARLGIRVNALAPGYIETDLNRDFLRSEAGQSLVKRIPQRRAGQPSDLRGPLLLLASDASAYMTGAVLVADGGHSIAGL